VSLLASAAMLALALAAPATPVASSAPALTAAALASDEALLHAYPTTIEDTAIVRMPRCGVLDTGESELATTVVDVRAHVPFPDVDKQERYTGRARFTIAHVTVRIPRGFEWPGMTARDRAAVETMLVALRHHEVGHIRVAVGEVAQLNARPLTVTPDAEVYRRTVTRHAEEGFAALARAQADYDQLTDHGRRQNRASGAFAGPPTELVCGAPVRPPRTRLPDPYASPSPAPAQ
jgi:predicted secreted Zn-dependent protease